MDLPKTLLNRIASGSRFTQLKTMVSKCIHMPSLTIIYATHWIIWYFTKTCSIPFEVIWKNNEPECLLLKPISKERKKIVTSIIPYFAVLRGAVSVLAWLPSVEFTLAGIFTVDFCLYTLTGTIIMSASMNSVVLVWYKDDVISLFNKAMILQRKFAGKHFKARSVLEVNDGGQIGVMLWVCIGSACVIVSPLLIAVLVYYLSNSPFGGAYIFMSFTAQPSIQKLVLVSFSIIDWTLVMATGASVVFMIYAGGELILTLNSMIKILGAPKFASFGRKEKRLCYQQLLLMTIQLNGSFSHLFPCLIYSMMIAAVITTTMLLRLNLEIASSIPVLYPMMLEIALGNVLALFPLLRYMETMKVSSDEVSRNIQVVRIKRISWVQTEEGVSARCVHVSVKRLYKLRPLRIRFGDFTWLDEGTRIDFFKTYVDNVVNLVFMVDIRNRSWLLRLPR